jgi:hypothetical protein
MGDNDWVLLLVHQGLPDKMCDALVKTDHRPFFADEQ